MNISNFFFVCYPKTKAEGLENGNNKMEITQDGLPDAAERLEVENFGDFTSGRCRKPVNCRQSLCHHLCAWD